jgi:YD repeat-containing protein
LSTFYSDGVTKTVTRTYNAAGLPATLVAGTGTTTFSYDSLGRLTSQAAPAGTVGYAYNLRDQVTTLTYPNGKQVTHTYDADGPMASVTAWLGGTTTFSYDANGAQSGSAAPNGVTTTIGHDDPGRVTLLSFTRAGTTLGSLAYTWDAAGHLRAEASTDLGPSRTYGYDDNGRVSDDTGTGYGYDAADHLTGNGTATQAYDAAGQLTPRTPNGGRVGHRRPGRRHDRLRGSRTMRCGGRRRAGRRWDARGWRRIQPRRAHVLRNEPSSPDRLPPPSCCWHRPRKPYLRRVTPSHGAGTGLRQHHGGGASSDR